MALVVRVPERTSDRGSGKFVFVIHANVVESYHYTKRLPNSLQNDFGSEIPSPKLPKTIPKTFR